MSKIDAVLSRKQPNLQIFLDNISSSQNLSAIIRSCDGVGVLNFYYASEDDCDMRIHKTITQGTHRWLNRKRIANCEKVAFLKEKQSQGFMVVVTNFSSRAKSFREVDYTQPVVLVMGNEKEGVSEEVLAIADREIIIPMQGMAQSLNVSVATALLLYEAERQLSEKSYYTEPQLSQESICKIKEEWVYRDVISRRSKGRVY